MSSTDRIEIHDQTNLLPRRQVVVVLMSLASALLLCIMDQNSIGVALPEIGKELNAASTISWAGTSSLIANTAFQVLYGRFSDIFGRKAILLSIIVLLAVGELLCGFAQNGPQFYAFRSLTGIATGGVMALSMMIISDIVTLEERGRYQGILGSFVGLGNTVGPFIAAGFTQHLSWRYVFYLICPLALASAVLLFFNLPPQNIPKENIGTSLRKIDWTGIVLASGGTILLLIPVSGIGSRFKADSPMVISMLTLGSVCLLTFVFNEWKLARLPMIPLRLFTNVPVAAMLVQNFLIGVVWYSLLYFLPIYYQSARGLSLSGSAAMLLPIVTTLALSSTLTGQYISRMGRYGEVLWLGFILWTLTAGLHCWFGRHTSLIAIAFILFFEGLSIGCVFQPTLVAAQAHTSKADRAVVISARNFIRSLGGAIGLAIASAIFSNSLESHLPNSLPRELFEQVHKSTFATPNLSKASHSDREAVLDAYLAASRSVFILWVAVMGTCLVLMVFVKDKGLKRKEELEAASDESSKAPSTEKLPQVNATQPAAKGALGSV